LKKTLNDFKFSNQEQSLKNIKQTLVKNELILEDLLAMNQNFSANISKFRVESHEIIYKLNETFQFFPRMESKIEDDFIGKVKLKNFYKEHLDQAEDVYKEIKDQDLVDYKVVKVNKAIVNLEKAIEFCPELSRAYILMGT
jgi:hypothetical protein